ncbi:FhaA domain-containing protein [Specibacter cremeus]|uniref:FhaA domain-containing protein n=1 Tax=Specibacter cremeus TaxID=1629051 RepID=UPI000F7B3148|nr:DUF3662 and FHA domain-containing protein [Specibacter cremeus]
MGLLDNVEKGIERAVRGAFSRGSKALQPVEMASALRRELDDRSMTLEAGRTLAPNVFSIRLSTPDFERARGWGTALAEELCDVVINHARGQGYILQGPVRVSFNHDAALKTGQPEITSATEKENGASQYAAPPANPPARPHAAPAQPPGINRPGIEQPAAPQPRYVRQEPKRPTAHKQPAGQPVLDIDGQRYSLNADSIVLGRSSEADILIDDTGVSRRHLEIRTDGGASTAVDLGSTNGSYLRGRRIEGSAPLSDGDTITMGRTKLTFRIMPARGGRD